MDRRNALKAFAAMPLVLIPDLEQFENAIRTRVNGQPEPKIRRVFDASGGAGSEEFVSWDHVKDILRADKNLAAIVYPWMRYGFCANDEMVDEAYMNEMGRFDVLIGEPLVLGEYMARDARIFAAAVYGGMTGDDSILDERLGGA